MKSTAALANFARKLGRGPPVELLHIFQAKCVSIATYGAGVWGYRDTKSIQQVDNTFLNFFWRSQAVLQLIFATLNY